MKKHILFFTDLRVFAIGILFAGGSLGLYLRPLLAQPDNFDVMGWGLTFFCLLLMGAFPLAVLLKENAIKKIDDFPFNAEAWEKLNAMNSEEIIDMMSDYWHSFGAEQSISLMAAQWFASNLNDERKIESIIADLLKRETDKRLIDIFRQEIVRRHRYSKYQTN